MSYLVAAYAVLWAISFGLVFSMVLRQRRLDSELQTLRVLVEDEPAVEQEQ
jgi:CcmD family protein